MENPYNLTREQHMTNDNKHSLVYSTENGDLRKEVASKSNSKSNPLAKQDTHPGIKNDGIIRIRREIKGRGGKTVTMIYGLPMKGVDLENFAKTIKQSCGTGGQLSDGILMIQGDKANFILSVLTDKGYTAKLAGG